MRIDFSHLKDLFCASSHCQMVVDDPLFRDLFLLPRFSQAWTLGFCPVLEDLVMREAKHADCVCPFCSFHHLIPLLLGLLAEAEALRVEGGVEAACASSHVKHMCLLNYTDWFWRSKESVSYCASSCWRPKQSGCELCCSGAQQR